MSNIVNVFLKIAQNKCKKHTSPSSAPLYPGDLVTHVGDQEIQSVSEIWHKLRRQLLKQITCRSRAKTKGAARKHFPTLWSLNYGGGSNFFAVGALQRGRGGKGPGKKRGRKVGSVLRK